MGRYEEHKTIIILKSNTVAGNIARDNSLQLPIAKLPIVYIC